MFSFTAPFTLANRHTHSTHILCKLHIIVAALHIHRGALCQSRGSIPHLTAGWQSFKYCSPILHYTLLSAYTNLLYINMQCAFNVIWRQTDLKKAKRNWLEVSWESTRSQVVTTEWSRYGWMRQRSRGKQRWGGFVEGATAPTVASMTQRWKPV